MIARSPSRLSDTVGRGEKNPLSGPVGGDDNLVQVKLTLTPIAGFKGGSSDDGDPDDAPRPVDISFTNDAALVPVSIRMSIAYLPLVVRFQHRCETFEACVP